VVSSVGTFSKVKASKVRYSKVPVPVPVQESNDDTVIGTDNGVSTCRSVGRRFLLEECSSPNDLLGELRC
jgi:hypothetical protein